MSNEDGDLIHKKMDEMLRDTKTHDMISSNTFKEDVINSYAILLNEFNLSPDETAQYLAEWVNKILAQVKIHAKVSALEAKLWRPWPISKTKI